jgi:GntR family transcriptional regulator, transcriptional repressor for pyruvate dehydrogenase complex
MTGPEFTAVKPVRAYETIVEQIERAIRDGSMKPGDRLPSERDLMVTFACSRATVREALRVLESAGLVRSRPGDPRGPEILQASPTVLHKTMERLLHAGSVDLTELLQFRIMLEGAACALAASHRTDDDLAAMDAAIDRMEAAIAAGATDFSTADVEFHQTVWRASGNRLLEVCGSAAREAVLGMMQQSLGAADDRGRRMREWLDHDREVRDAIARRNGTRAGALTRMSLIEYYAPYVDDADRASLELLAF